MIIFVGENHTFIDATIVKMIKLSFRELDLAHNFRKKNNTGAIA
jgi:hypothetical protein